MAWPKPMTIVEIEWEDSMSMNGWHHGQETRDFTNDPKAQCRSVGYLVERTTKGMVIAQGQAEGGALDDLAFIPKSAIRRIRVLEKAMLLRTSKGGQS